MSLDPGAPHPLFDAEAYGLFYGGLLSDEASDRQVGLVEELLGAAGRTLNVLDLACGYGRHANRLAARGHRVSGRDASPTFLAQARQDAVQRGVEVDYREEDMRALSDVECFDGAICLFTAFGYFSDEENLDVLRRVRRALRPGGRFVLDVQNRDFIMAHFLRYIVHERPSGELMVDRNAFDPLTGRTSLRRSYVLHDRRVDGELSVRTYNLQELQWLFRDVGLTFEAAYGSWTKDEPGPDRPRLIVLGQRGAG